MAHSLIPRVAIVTGAAQGIGRAIAQKLAKDGFNLALFDLPSCEPMLDDVARGVRKDYGARAINVTGDVSAEEDVKRLVDVAAQELGGVGVMVANAGIHVMGALHEITSDQVDKMMDVNVKGVFLCFKYAAMRMIEQGKGGRLIAASSVAGRRGMNGQSVYSASKFAVRGLTQSAAMDYGKYGIAVNAYAPGAIKTALLDKADERESARLGLAKGEWGAQFAKCNLLGRLGESEDVANLVSFLASKDSSFITGQTFTVDGGIILD